MTGNGERGTGKRRAAAARGGAASLVIAAVLGVAATLPAQAAKGGIVRFVEVPRPVPGDASSRRWNWEVQVSPATGARRFRIVQRTRGAKGDEAEYSFALFAENAVQRAAGDPIHFMLRSGDEKPTPNLNKQGNVGLGVSFTRVGGGFGASNWIVLPGRIVRPEPVRSGQLRGGKLVLLGIDSRDPAGGAHRTEVLLEETSGTGSDAAATAPSRAAGGARAAGDTSGWKTYRGESIGFEVRYPGEWRASAVKGPEGAIIMESPKAGMRARTVQFWVQRGANPRGLPIDRWYADQVKNMKGAPPPYARPDVIGGRPAIRQEAAGSLGKHFAFFVSLDRTDVFEVTIGQTDPRAPLDDVYETILRTIRFVR